MSTRETRLSNPTGVSKTKASFRTDMLSVSRMNKTRWCGAVFLGLIALTLFCLFTLEANGLTTWSSFRNKPASSVNSTDRRLFDLFGISLRQGDTYMKGALTYNESGDSEDKDVLPTIFMVTPTYTRPVQKAELTHMCMLLQNVKNVFWIVVEDSLNRTDLVRNLISNCKIPSVHMNVKSLRDPQLTIRQRNLALDWLRVKVNVSREHGVLYFADDDNTYDPRIFEEMRYTKKISMWPVGLVGGAFVETPLVENGTVVDWLSLSYNPRHFLMDMAGFAVNTKLLLDFPNAKFDLNAGLGWLETQFLDSFNITLQDLEPKANNCTEVLVWHTQRPPASYGHGVPFFNKNRTVPKFEV